MDFILSEGLELELEALIGSDEKAISLANLAPGFASIKYDTTSVRSQFLQSVAYLKTF